MRYDETTSSACSHRSTSSATVSARRASTCVRAQALCPDTDESPRVAEPQENLGGRGLPAWRFFCPQLQKAFPARFGDVDLETFYGAINKVEPSFIRVEADEATYNMHIILRFELEQEILSGDLALEDLPEAWNSRMAEYLGVEVPDDTRGVLQDIHWSGGAFGYFPTYSLGNVISVQLWDKARGELPDLDAQFEQGEFGELSGWLRENLHRHGRKYTSKEMLERITGGGMDPGRGGGTSSRSSAIFTDCPSKPRRRRNERRASVTDEFRPLQRSYPRPTDKEATWHAFRSSAG